eukprot:CAMPEP_0201481978 /NCGR_PEP_ID=MMETSP0151_2-20130828/6236_1 /ASSEMBLY_ACC=CAM_ASM_000257 /TAXON_ID=200890 /ORGANISM="Paramoeba atlantica, Strain 621/1 / CCAP 1560/9" /LENGTH=87 /DNA_ID=CAMNT_0047864423 /DNA_START=1 /DNA_END=260 /DNA_ORIENTATION=-
MNNDNNLILNPQLIQNIRNSPAGRLLDPIEVADVVLRLSLPVFSETEKEEEGKKREEGERREGTWVTGQEVIVDGVCDPLSQMSVSP